MEINHSSNSNHDRGTIRKTSITKSKSFADNQLDNKVDIVTERNRTASLDRKKRLSKRSHNSHTHQDSDPTNSFEENKRLSQIQGRPVSRYGSTEKLLQSNECVKTSKRHNPDEKPKQSIGKEYGKVINKSNKGGGPFKKMSRNVNDSVSKYEIWNNKHLVENRSDNNATSHSCRDGNTPCNNHSFSTTSTTEHEKKTNPPRTSDPKIEFNNSNEYFTNGSMTGMNSRNQQYLSIDMDVLQKSQEDLHVAGYNYHGLRHSFPSSPFTHLTPLNVPKKSSRLFYSIVFIVCSLVLVCPTIVLLSVLLPLSYFIKKFCSCCCCYGNKCQAGELLSKKELMALQQCQSNVYQALLVLETGLDIHRIRDLINARVVCAEDDEGIKMYPKLTKKIVTTCSGLAWVQDSNFLMKNHVFSMPSSLENLEDLQEYISKISCRSLAFGQAPWEIQVLHGFGEHHDTILFLRLSSCIMDGVSLMYVLQKSLADTGFVTSPKLKFARQNIFLNSLKSLFVGPLVFMQKYLFIKKDFNMFHGEHVHMSGKQILTWSEPYDLEKANRIKQITRSTMNDVLLSVTAGCIRNYFNQNGIKNPYDINNLLAVHYNAGCSYYSTENNNFIFISVPLPTNTEGAIPRLWNVKHVMDNISSSALFYVTRGAIWVTSCLFSVNLFHKLWDYIHGKFSCVISNIPGPEGTLTFASKQIKSVIYWVPPLNNMAIGISFLSYGQSIRMAVSAERSIVPNPEVLTKDFIAQMDELSELLAHRRIPGEYLSKKMETMQQLEDEIKAEPTIHQLQMKMAVVHQEIQDLKVQLEGEGRQKHSSKDQKIIKRIEALKEQYREILVEIRQRKAAESENAMILTEDDNDYDEDKDDGEARRPFRRRTLSISSRISRLSTASVSSTARPLTAATTPSTPDYPDDISQDSFRTDGMSHINRPMYRRQQSDATDEMQILEYASSPLTERRFRTF